MRASEDSAVPNLNSAGASFLYIYINGADKSGYFTAPDSCHGRGSKTATWLFPLGLRNLTPLASSVGDIVGGNPGQKQFLAFSG